MAPLDQSTALFSAAIPDSAPRTSTFATRSSVAALPALHEKHSELGDLLAGLPPELLSMILHSLLNDGSSEYGYRHPERRFLSRASLVCREWCSILRPKLFARLRIETSAQCRFLLDALRRPHNEWLPGAIKQLGIEAEAMTDTCLSIDRFCRSLAGKLPSLVHFSIYPGGYDDVGVSASSLQPFFAHHSTLRRLELSHVVFLSFSALVHTLQDMANLEELEMDTTSWDHLEDRPPTRMTLSSFPKLRFVKFSHEVPHFWMAAWLFAPLLARRCADAPEDPTTNNSDAALLSILTRSCCEHEAFQCDLELSYDKDTDVIGLECFPTAASSWYCHVELWPSTSVSEDGKWSAIRGINCRDTDGKALEEMDWDYLDEVIARDALRLKQIYFSSDQPNDWTVLLTRLPNLSELNKVRVKASKPKSKTVDYLPPDDLDHKWLHAMMASPAYRSNIPSFDAPDFDDSPEPPLRH